MATLKNKVGVYNAKLIQEFLPKYRALPEEPQDYRCLTTVNRLCTISRLLKHKALDKLTEADLQELNLAFRKEGFKSAADYRKALKKFLKVKDKKRFFDLIESDYLRNKRSKENEGKLVDPQTFWTDKEVSAYLSESKRHSLRQSAWAGIWLSAGMRPHEIFLLKRKDLVFEESPPCLTIRVSPDTKTGSRIIVLQGQEALGAWNYVQPYWQGLQESDLLFPISYEMMARNHKQICKQIGLPKEKSWKFYMARKRTLSKWYNEIGIVRAAQMCGHVQGSKAMAHYCALTPEQMKGIPLNGIQSKQCFNPKCLTLNEPHFSQCQKCGAPLNQKQFAELQDQNMGSLQEQVKQLQEKLLQIDGYFKRAGEKRTTKFIEKFYNKKDF